MGILVDRLLGRRRRRGSRDDLYVSTVRSAANVEGVAVDVLRRSSVDGRDVFHGIDRVTLESMGVASSVPELRFLRRVEERPPGSPPTVAEVVLATVQALSKGADAAISTDLRSALPWCAGGTSIVFDGWRDPAATPQSRVSDLSWTRERVLPLCLSSGNVRRTVPVPVDPSGRAVFLRAGDERLDRIGSRLEAALSAPAGDRLLDLASHATGSMRRAAYVPDMTPFRFGPGDRFLARPIRPGGVVDEALERVVLAEAVAAFEKTAGEHEGSSVWLAPTIRKTADWDVSWVVVDRDGSVAGLYLLSPDRIGNRAPVLREDLDELHGIEGTSIVTTRGYKGLGIGSVLKDLPARMGYGYVFGEAMSSLGNVEHWRRRREVVHSNGRSTFTLEILGPGLEPSMGRTGMLRAG